MSSRSRCPGIPSFPPGRCRSSVTTSSPPSTRWTRSVYSYGDAQRRAAEALRDAFQAELKEAGYGAITTEIEGAPEFYYAEDYHQQYLAKNPSGYCGLGGTGVSCPVGCVVAGKLPRLESGFEPTAAVAQARVYFRAGGTPNWYFVPMTHDKKSFQGVLPKPLKSTKTLEYYIETLDAAVNSSRTSEYSAQVVSDPGACSEKLLVATIAAAAKVAVGLPAGASGLSLVPAGFAADGIVAAGAAGAAGATSAAGGGAGAGAAGGIGASALVVAGVVVAGGAAAAVVTKGGDAGKNTGDTGPGSTSGPSGTIYNVIFGLPPAGGIDVSACAGHQLGWCCQNLHVDSNGGFNDVWSPLDRNTLRLTGQLTATTLNATLSCARTGTPTGSMSATGSGGSYSGTFDFAGSRGTIQVTKQ